MADNETVSQTTKKSPPVNIARNCSNSLCIDTAKIEYLIKFQLLGAVDMSFQRFEELTGISATLLPELAEGIGIGSLKIPQPNWYYRILRGVEPGRKAAIPDPTIAEILKGADIVPKVPLTENFDPVLMTYRHLSPVSNVEIKGTDRISTAAELEAFTTILKDRGTGEIVRIDVDAARRFGQDFLEHNTILEHLNQQEIRFKTELSSAIKQNSSKNTIARIAKRLEWLETAREYAIRFKEGQGIGKIPNEVITVLKEADESVKAAILREKLFLGSIKFLRYGGKVLLIYGAVKSIFNVIDAPQEEKVRVASRETGGWAFSIAGAEAGAAIFAEVGAFAGLETGPGAVVTAALGGLVGGIVGFFCGEEIAEKIYDNIETAKKIPALIRDTPTFLETFIMMFGSQESRRKWVEMEEVLTGEESVWESFEQ